jgi:hypothetical protein
MSDRADDPASPRERLRRDVRSHVEALAHAGLSPNRTVVLGGAVIAGWLIDDPYAQMTSRRWLLMSDGDVWCEAAYVATPWSADLGASHGWLSGPTPALDAVLELSADEVREGGLLARPTPSGAPVRVSERRTAIERRAGADRRVPRASAPDVERRRGDRRSGADRRHTA